MIETIKKLRQKSESHRRRWHIGLTVVIMAVVVAGWAVVMSNRISLAISGSKNSEVLSPFSTFKNDITANVEQIRQGYLILKGDKK